MSLNGNAGATEERAQKFRERFQAIRSEIGKVIVGQEEIVQGVLTCLFTGGHVLLEGVPGLGKTLLVKTLADAVDLTFSRVQFTPDLMPADIIGTNIVVDDPDRGRHIRFQRGPLFGHVVLADEVNRATPKTQSALLEAMQELSVTVGGIRHPLEPPFFVLATQNPIEMEGTYPLPEAQLDRFRFKLKVTYPSFTELSEIVERTTKPADAQVRRAATGPEVEAMKQMAREVLLATPVKDFVSRIVLATHPTSEHAPDTVKRYVRFGASPRGAQALVLGGKVYALLDGRFNVGFDDIEAVALPALRHRVLLSFEGEAERVDPDDIIRAVVEKVRTEEVAAKVAR